MSGRRAFLIYGGRAYHANEPAEPGISPDTPVTRLIEGIWDQYPSQAFHLLRSRIFTNYPLTLRCQGAVQLAAKRVSPLSADEFNARLTGADSICEVTPKATPSFRVELPSSRSPDALAQFIREFQFPTSDRPILAVLTDSLGQPALAAANSSSSNRLRHAEVNLVREFVRTRHAKIPSGSTLWVSLKPCRMCASFIHELSEDASQTRVIYLEDDPGPKARNSPLQAMIQFFPS